MAGTLLFKVKYEFLTNREITQGYRCDWAYDKKGPLYMIWPSFVGLDGVELKEGDSVPKEGLANMYLREESYEKFHREHLVLDDGGLFMEGKNPIANVVVIEVQVLSSYFI